MKKFDLSKLVVLKIKDVYSHSLSREAEGSAKMTNSALIIKRSGVTEYTVDGRKLVSDSNNVVFIPAGSEYSMEVCKSGSCIVMEFDIHDPSGSAVAEEYFFNNARDILTTAKNVLHYWTLKGPAYEAKCLSEFYSIITQIATIDSYSNTLAGKYRMIHRSIKYIEENYADSDLYTPQLAEISEIGETYYRNIFIAVFGMPPAKYIQQYRVDKAKEILASTDKSIEEIALAVGFANSSYFCKVFKSVTGMTPLAFAEKAKLIG